MAKLFEVEGHADVVLVREPDDLENRINAFGEGGVATARNWTDLYLAAVAAGNSLRFVNFDSGFRRFNVLNLEVLT